MMGEAFLIRALAAGIGVALVAGPLGCFVVWRRMAYFGSAMAHAALLGVALALLAEVDPLIGVFVVAAGVAIALYALQGRADLTADALLGILAHGTLAVGLVLIAFMTDVRVDLLGYLFGDILAVGTGDLALIYGGGAVALAVLWRIWRALLAETVSPDIARAEGLATDRARLAFLLLMAGVIAAALKLVGILLITAMLIVPAAAARAFATGPVGMAVLAAMIGCLSVVAGLWTSFVVDTPSGPTIVVAALGLFCLALLVDRLRGAREAAP